MGETRKVGKGGTENGPAILPIANSFEIFCLVSSGAKLSKCDIKSAFRLLRIFPGDFDQLGFVFQDKYYFDKCLPFGAMINCESYGNHHSFWGLDLWEKHVKLEKRGLKMGDFDQLGFVFQDKYYFDKCLPFGASINCALFEKLSTALHWFTEIYFFGIQTCL
jgi:hypothetical protein